MLNRLREKREECGGVGVHMCLTCEWHVTWRVQILYSSANFCHLAPLDFCPKGKWQTIATRYIQMIIFVLI